MKKNIHNKDESLYAENQRLRKQLKAFVTKARQNEEKLKRFQNLELKLIACTRLFDLMQSMVYEFRFNYQHDRISVIIHDPEYECRRILEEENVTLEEHPDIILVDSLDAVESFYGLSPKAILGAYNEKENGFMFPYDRSKPQSCAFLPMIRKGELRGSLNIASNKDRFTPGSGSEFLQRVSDIFTACLKNVINSERLKRVGLTDGLTGVNNRRYFDQRMYEEITASQRSKNSLTFLFFDIDHFKHVNDTYGHQTGDAILREVSNLIRLQLRVSDVLARYGGEEFAALLINTPLNSAYEIADRIRQSVAQKDFIASSGEIINITISIGISSLQNMSNNTDPESLGIELLQEADECLYQAKRDGRNRVIYNHKNQEFVLEPT